VSTTATADDDATALTFSRTANADAESSPDVGSSRSSFRLGDELDGDRQAALLAAAQTLQQDRACMERL
jgi:hypothetical protein